MTVPTRVWAIGKIRDPEEYRTPIVATDEAGAKVGIAPLTVVDPDGERALPVYSMPSKARKGIENLMSAEEREENVGVALVEFETLFAAASEQVEGAPKVDYLGLDMMGEGGERYTLVRVPRSS